MQHHAIHRGLDIPIAGHATGTPVELEAPQTVAWDPREVRGLNPRLAARAGDEVRQGQPVFFDKTFEAAKFVAPIAGRVKEIRRGARRVITDYVIERDDALGAVEHKAWSAGALGSISRDEAVRQILEGGLWYTLRSRPLSTLPDPEVVPQSILVAATETGPLQPGADVLLSADDKEALQAGIHVLAALTDGKVYLTVPHGSSHPALAGVSGCEVHAFSGPHPSGDPAVQINLIDPPRGAGQVWYVRAWDVARIGKLFLTGRFPADAVYAAVGAGVKQPRYVRTILGAPMRDIVGETTTDEARWIRGSVLTGTTCDPGAWAPFCSHAIHVLPAEIQRGFMSWMLPELGTWSANPAFLLGLLGSKKTTDMRPALNGGHRGLVPSSVYRRVVATPDIYPEFLMKAMTAGDLEESIELGLLDLSEEEAALCTYVCPSKIEYDALLRDTLERYRKEAS